MLQNRVSPRDQANFRSKLRTLSVEICLVLAIALALFIAPGAASHAFAEGDITHIVKPGESLSTIAARYGVSVSAIAGYNGISNPNLLRAGQALRIPGTTVSPAPVQPQYPTPTTVSPDNSSNNASVPTNNKAYPQPTPTPYIVDPNRPRPTSTLVVATRVPSTPTVRVHVVTASDTLTGIANLYGTSAWAIKARNGLTDAPIYRGQKLIIP
ncbi:MAG: LysM peptidoglycan-binding domain-containing protein [Chloroflexi bacterium]|nr:MAG: LysM peptidoglycan-binding domain-containing protein [Chloroflexota bacterium]